MKTILSTLFLLLSALMPTTLWAQELAGDEAIEPYAALNEDSTMLTFYYDAKKTERDGMSVGPFTSDTGRGWHSARKTITQVVFDDSFADYTGLTSTNLWFCNLSALTTITGVSNVNTENVTTFRTMFSGCSSLTALDLTGWNTSSVANMAFMFEGCSGLTSLVVPFNTFSVTAMDNMFLGCSGLTALDLSTFNTANVKSTSYMFSSCTNLKTVYVGSEWSMDAVTQSGQMFNNCPSLVGGKGTAFSTSHMTAEYAHIDGGTSNPGYLTDVNAPAAAQDGDFFTALNADGVLMSFRVLSAADKTCEIYKGYEIAAIDTETSGAMNIPETVKDSLDRQYTVTRIGHYAFLHCKNITEVTTPSTVTSIGNNAFHDCASLTNYDIPAGVTELCDRTFYETHFKHIVIPANITNIMHESFGSSSAITVTSYIQQPFALGENAFGYSTQTATLYVPVGTIDAYKATDGWKDFYRIVENSNIQFADNIVKEICVTNWDKNGDGELSTSEAGAVTSISDVFKKQSISSFDELQYFTGLNKIDNEAFSGCTQLSSVRLPLTITEIGYAAFVDCPITSIEIPSSVTNIGNQAFLGTSLETLSIPSSVTTVGLSAFNATNLKSVNIPATLTSIGQSAFLNYGLESLVVEEGNPVYDSRNNCNALIETSSNTLLTGCNNTVIPETVTSIGEAAFRWMNNLTSITIPASVEHIGNYAFDVSSYLTSIVCEREYAVEAESNIFNDYSYQEATLYVPAAGIQSYNMTSPWNLFQHKETLGGSTEPETYAVLSGDNTTLTFYYDTKKSERNGMDIGPFVNAEERPWHQMRESIENVIFDSAVTNDTTITSTANWLAGFSSLKNIDGLQWLNTKNVTSMESMFSLCSAINWLNLSNFNTSKVTNMEQMFLNCETMETVDLSSFNTSHVTSFNRMFTSCLKLKSLDLSNFNTSEVKGMVSMFSDCSDLSAIYVGNNWDASKVEDSSDMFVGCTNLVGGAGTTYDINHTDATYAHIDGGSNNPGYLTDKDAKVWSVIGTINGNWDTDTEMTSEDGVNYTASFPYMAAGKYEFKIRANGDWTENYGADGKQDGDNIVATVEEDLSGVIVMFNAETKEITYSIMPPVYSVTGSKVDEDGNFISGWLDWADDADMTKDENGIYSVTFDNMEVGNYEYKVRTNHEWTYNWGSSGDLGGENMLLTIAQAGPVTIYFDPETHLASTAYPQKMEQVATPTFSWNEDKLTISSETEGATITYKFEDGYYLVGGNGEWSSSKVQKMSQSSEEYIYTYVLQGFDTNLWFAFGDVAALNAIADGDWSQLFGATVDGSDLSGKYDRRYNLGADKSFNVDGSAPYYRFTINTQDKTYLIEPLDSDPGFIASSDVVYTYTDPVEIKSDVFISAVAKKEGMKDSETTTLDYPYTAWQKLRDAEDKGQSVIAEYAGNDKVPEKLLDELKYYIDEAHQMYVQRTAERASIEDMTAKIQSMIQDVMAMAAAEDIIQFADSVAKTICVANWDTNGDGELSKDEAAAVTDLDGVFKNQTSCTSFDELRFFTSLTALGTDEFRSCPFTSVILPPSLQSIGRYAFDGTKLTEITIPASVTYIDGTGLNDRYLQNFYVDEASNSFCAVDGVLFSKDTTLLQNYPVGRNDASYVIPNTVTTIGRCSFYGSKLASVVIPNGVKRIDHGAFRYCSLESIDIPNTVEIIEGENFQYCGRLTSAFVPSSVSSLDEEVFSACASLVTIDVDSNNPNYASVDGILYSKDMTTLQIYPAGRPDTSYTIADYVRILGSHAFDFAGNLTSVVIPNSVESIGYLNFGNISGLMSVTVQRAEPIQIGTGYFSRNTLENGTLYVPKGAKQLYEVANGWKEFANIVEMDTDPTFDFDTNGVLTVNSDVTMTEALEEASKKHDVEKWITAIVWNSNKPISNSELQSLTNPNMLIFVPADSLAPQNRDNVVIGDLAKNIVLKDVTEGNGSFYSPKSFKAEMISYTHEYRQQTEIGVARGWETIALPFTVQTIMHEKQGRIVPFGISDSGANFWLRQMTSNGLQRATQIEANVPYIISMPNNEAYYAQNNLAGRVTFSSQDAMVPMTEYTAVHMQVEGGMLMFVPCFQGQTATQEVYALNVGEARGNYPEGSVFEANYRDIRPFEAYTVHEGNYGPAPQYIPVFDLNEAGFTGIEEVRCKMEEGRSDVWYDLNGRRLQGEPTQKGVYIKNGRKQVVK